MEANTWLDVQAAHSVETMLTEIERMEFGQPAIVAIAEAVAGSPCLLQANYAQLMEHVAGLYCADGSSSVSAFEAHELATSVFFALGITGAAHEVPCDIDYQLSESVDPKLMGIDYVEAYLAQLLSEARWIARFDVGSCVAVLERACPDYRGLHVNLYDLLLPRKDELAPASATDVT